MSKPNSLPNLAHVLGYNTVYGSTVSFENRLEFIKSVPSEFIIGEFASINYESKPPGSLLYSTSFKQQKKWVVHFLRTREDLEELVDAWSNLSRTVGDGDEIVVFNRATTLVALNELILKSPCKLSAKTYKATTEDWVNIFKYYLCVSEYIDSHAPTDDEKAIGVENVSAQTLLINDLNINEHPLLKLNRYEPLMKHLESHRKIGPHLGAYLAVMGYEKIGDYLQSFTNLYIKPNHKTKEGIGCHYKVDSNDEIILQRLKVLSTRHLDQTKSAFDIVEIKRSPFFKLSFSDTDFVLLDNQILIDKIYDVFIEEFYFSYLRDKGMRIDEYKGAVGEAFQEYIATILRRTLARRYMTFKALDELKVGIPEVELADIYFRQNKKVLLGEIKVTKLTARQFQGNIDDLFFEGREKFYSRFGLEQLAESVRKFCESPQLFEVGNTAKAYTIYPVLILSERSFQTPLMPEMCKLRFLELLTQMNLAPHRVIPLSVMHTSDVELIDENLTKGSIWRIFEGTYKKLTFSRHVCEVLGQMKVRPKFRLDFYKLLQNSQR